MLLTAAWKLISGAAVLAIFAVGVWDVLLNLEPNLCQMTYMFEYPNYVPVSLNKSVTKQYPDYGLYVYGEGSRTAEYERHIYSGIPVLFVPGNAGSHRQARSLGSVLLRMSEKRQNAVEFDVFAVDFNEELAVFYGGFISGQTEFVHHCLLKISSLYNAKSHSQSPPPRIILVGHSVGGLIARGLFLQATFDPSSVDTIFTLSTPHKPVIIADVEWQNFYLTIDHYWSKHAETTLKSLVLVSFAGGHRDVLVRSDRSDLSDGFSHGRFLSSTTTAVPGVWASTDHLCIVWCKQLVLAMGKALFDMVDGRTRRGLATDAGLRLAVAQKYFVNPVSRVEMTRNVPPVRGTERDVTVRFEPAGPLRLVTKKYQPPSLHAFSLLGNVQEEDVFVWSNHWMQDWISVCHDDTCDNRSILSAVPTRFPWFSEDAHFYAIIPHELLQAGPFLLFELPKRDDAMTLQIEATPAKAHLPRVKLAWKSLFATTEKYPISNSSYFRLNVQLDEIWMALNVYITVSDRCAADRGMVRFTVPGQGFAQDTHRLIKDHSRSRFPLKLQTARISGADLPLLELFLNKDCTYEVTFGMAWVDILGQIMRFYATQIPAFFAAVVVVQMLPLYRDGSATLQDHVLVNGICAGVIFLTKKFLDFVSVDAGFDGASATSSIVIWTVLYCVTYCAALLFETILALVVSLYSYPVHFIAQPIVTRLRSIKMGASSWPSRLLVFPVFALATTVLSYATCGENGILLALALYFIKVCYNKRNSVISVASTKSDVTESAKVLLLAVLVTMLNVIPSLVWTKRLPSGLVGLLKATHNRLDPDPSLAVSVVVGVLLDFALRKGLGKAVLSRANGFFDFAMALVIYGVAVAILVFARRLFYLVNFFLSLLLTAMSCDVVRRAFTDSQPLRRAS